MVTLEPMSAEFFANWSPRTWASYRAELIQAGESEAAAAANVANTVAVTMPNGVLAAGQHVFEVRNGELTVGAVWLAERGDEWFIYDIEIDEEFRGRGLGRATMGCIEQFVRGRGGSALGLSVFGFNEVAQRLYTSLGYETMRLQMKKTL